jgi:hypothetical protein
MTVASVSNDVDPSPWIYTDADNNTLWDTNAVFANAQLQLPTSNGCQNAATFRHLSVSIALKRKFLAVDLTVSLAYP